MAVFFVERLGCHGLALRRPRDVTEHQGLFGWIDVSTLSYSTAGESHGRALVALVEGMPAGVGVDSDFLDGELMRRQGGFGRGARMRIEHDVVEVLSGVRRGVTIGSPIAFCIVNRDHRIDEAPAVGRPRPGHADLAGALKRLTTDCRETLERASARETAARVAAGALCRCLLREFGIAVAGYVVQILDIEARFFRDAALEELCESRDANQAYCPDASAAERMIKTIERARADGDTVGGVVEVQVRGQPPGLGSAMRWQDKLDGRLMQAVGSIQGIKGVEIGLGFGAAGKRGSAVHDEIEFDASLRDTPRLGFKRGSNNAGGLEGGMTNGEPIVLRAAMKPISTLKRGLGSVDLCSKEAVRCDYERSDVSAVPAASVVAENVVAFEIARVLLEKFGGDTLGEVRASYEFYFDQVRSLGD